MASLTQWTWVWVNSGSWWWIRRPGLLQSMGSQRATELNWMSTLFDSYPEWRSFWRNPGEIPNASKICLLSSQINSQMTLAPLPHLTASLQSKVRWEQGGVTCSRSQEQLSLLFRLFDAVLHIRVVSISDLSVRNRVCSVSSLSAFKKRMYHEP